jgi:hypothetical protein
VKSSGNLLSKLSREVEGDSPKVCVSEKIIEVVREELKDEAQVIPPNKVVLQFHYVILVTVICPVHDLQQANFNLK